MAKDNNRNLVAALSYLLGFLTGIVILLVEKDDKFIRFHAAQSVLLFGALFVLQIVVNMVFGYASGLLSGLLSIAGLILWIVSMLKAYKGEMFKWSVVGDYAEKWVNK